MRWWIYVFSVFFWLHTFPPPPPSSFFSVGSIHSSVLGWSEQTLPSVTRLSSSLLSFHPIFSSPFLPTRVGGGGIQTFILPLNSSFINQTSAVCTQKIAGTCNWPLTNASGCFIFSPPQNRPLQKKKKKTPPKLSLCLSMCQREKGWEREKKISKTDDLKATTNMTTSSLSFIKLHSLHFFPLFSLTQIHPHSPRAREHMRAHRRSGADILGGVIPGVESLRSPCCDPVILGRGRVLDACRERKRLYIKNTFLPEAVSFQQDGFTKTCARAHAHSCKAYRLMSRFVWIVSTKYKNP